MAVLEVYEAITGYNLASVAEIVRQELDKGTDVSAILNEGLIAAMDDVGSRFSEGALFVPEMLMAAKVMQAGLDVIKPRLLETDIRAKGIIVMGTVQGDLHDIGKNLVMMMLEGGGFEVIDLGVDVEPRKFVAAAKEHGAQVIALSALLTTTMPAMEGTVATLKKEGLDVKIMVGGAPVTQNYANKIGADGYGEDAPGAVLLAREFVD
ncbi:MAG: corrinoid protein [Deltaproteobacteria bacterium]|nr:corrinoid protein [Deltaproteobacteria bacterium]